MLTSLNLPSTVITWADKLLLCLGRSSRLSPSCFTWFRWNVFVKKMRHVDVLHRHSFSLSALTVGRCIQRVTRQSFHLPLSITVFAFVWENDAGVHVFASASRRHNFHLLELADCCRVQSVLANCSSCTFHYVCLFYEFSFFSTREIDRELWESLYSGSFSKWQRLTLEWRKLKWYDFAHWARCAQAENGFLVLCRGVCTPWTLK